MLNVIMLSRKLCCKMDVISQGDSVGWTEWARGCLPVARYGVSVSGPQQTSALAAVGAKTAPCSLTLFCYDQSGSLPTVSKELTFILDFVTEKYSIILKLISIYQDWNLQLLHYNLVLSEEDKKKWLSPSLYPSSPWLVSADVSRLSCPSHLTLFLPPHTSHSPPHSLHRPIFQTTQW